MAMIGSRVSVAARSGCCFVPSALPPRPVLSGLQRRTTLEPLHARGSRSMECASTSSERVTITECSSSSRSEGRSLSPALDSITSSSSPLPLLAFTLLTTAALASICAEPSAATQLHPSSVPLFDLSESGEEFWPNVVRYGRYFVTVMLGTGYVMLRPIANMFNKNPASAALAVALIIGALVGTKITLETMLGISSQVEYQSSNFM